MSKEKIIEEFDDKFGIYWSNYKNTLYRCNPNDILDRPSIITTESIKQFISKVYDQVRLETIREVEEKIEQDFKNHLFPNQIEEIKSSLNKLK